MLKNDTLKNGTSRIGLYGSAPWDVVLPAQDMLHSEIFTCDARCDGNAIIS